jgi:hypothetical protein
MGLMKKSANIRRWAAALAVTNDDERDKAFTLPQFRRALAARGDSTASASSLQPGPLCQ